MIISSTPSITQMPKNIYVHTSLQACVKWNEVSYGKVLGDNSTMYIRVTLYWGYLIVLWLFHSGVSCTVVVLVICVLVFTVFFVLFHLYIYTYSYLFCLYLVYGLLPPSDNSIAVSSSSSIRNNNTNSWYTCKQETNCAFPSVSFAICIHKYMITKKFKEG